MGSYYNLGWAWTDQVSVDRFNRNCAPRSLTLRTDPPGGWFESLWKSQRPKYQGNPAWYQLWGAPDRRFMGYIYVGFPTAQLVTRCSFTEVFTSYGQPVAA